MQSLWYYPFPSLSLHYPHSQSHKSKNPNKTLIERKPSRSPLLPKPPSCSSREPKFELLGKPSPIRIPTTTEESAEEKPSSAPDPDDEEEALAPFLKFFRTRDSGEEETPAAETRPNGSSLSVLETDAPPIDADYYDPKPGDLAVGVVVSGNENKMDVNIGADFLGTMLTKEAMPMYEGELEYLLWDAEKDGGSSPGRGRMGVVSEDAALGEGEGKRRSAGRPVVEAGTVVFAEVLGRTLSGRPLLSSRRMYRRVAWHRVRQVLFSICNITLHYSQTICLTNLLQDEDTTDMIPF